MLDLGLGLYIVEKAGAGARLRVMVMYSRESGGGCEKKEFDRERAE